MLSKNARRETEARLELSRRGVGLAPLIASLAPGIVMLVFGDWLQKALAVSQSAVWLFATLVAFACLAGVQIVSLQRKVDALTHLLADGGV